MVGKEVVILGSGDIGLIMARRMTLEGAKVKVVAELMPYSGGLKRNIVQCLNDFDIPLKLSHTVVNIEGKERVKGITLAQVGPDRKPIPGTEEHYDCDTLLLSCGLIPENELTRNMGVAMNPVTSGPMVNDRLETGIEGVFACGNVLHVHDLVDYVSEEAALAGQNAAKYVKSGETKKGHSVTLKAENGVRYTVPQSIDTEAMADKLTVRFRVADVYKNRSISVYFDGERVSSRKKRVLAPGEMEQVILTKESLEKYPDLKVICAPTTVGIAAAAKYLQDNGSACKLTGLGLPSEMLEYTGADDEHSCPYFYLWDMQGLGKLSALTTIALINDEITGAADETFTAGDLGDYTITAADDGGTEVVLGAPLEFNPDNIEEMAKLY